EIARIVFLNVMARARDGDPTPVGETGREVKGSVFGNYAACAAPGQQKRSGHVRDPRLEACEMLQDRGMIRWTAAVALPHEASIMAALEKRAHPVTKALRVALRTHHKRHIHDFVHGRGAPKARHEAAHPRRSGERWA